MGAELFLKVAEKYPFLTFFSYANVEYVGIIQNKDSYITSFYDFGNITNVDHKKLFLDLANVWWWESRRDLPINIFLKHEWVVFKPYLRTFTNKDLQILHGPCVSLSDLLGKKSKRKSIVLVKRCDRS